MDDPVQRADLGVEEGAERRDLDAVAQRLGETVLDLGNRSGL